MISRWGYNGKRADFIFSIRTKHWQVKERIKDYHFTFSFFGPVYHLFLETVAEIGLHKENEKMKSKFVRLKRMTFSTGTEFLFVSFFALRGLNF